MATQILALGTTAADSSDFTFTGPTVVGIKTTGGVQVLGGEIRISVKGDDNNYYPFGKLSKNAPVLTIQAPGTYRFSRVASPYSVGAFHG